MTERTGIICEDRLAGEGKGAPVTPVTAEHTDVMWDITYK